MTGNETVVISELISVLTFAIGLPVKSASLKDKLEDAHFVPVIPYIALFNIFPAVLTEIKNIITHYNPSVMLVQGDTTTVMAAGLAAFYKKIPVGHIEAGLRTGDMQAPYPEEFNRVSLGIMSTYHFTPTVQATAHLLSEGKKRETIFCVGNTVVDALRIIENKIILEKKLRRIEKEKKLIGKNRKSYWVAKQKVKRKQNIMRGKDSKHEKSTRSTRKQIF